MIKNLFILFLALFLAHANSSTYFGFGYLNPQNPAIITALAKKQHYISVGTHIVENSTSTLTVPTFTKTHINLQSKYAYAFKKHAFFIANDESIFASSEDKLFRSDMGALEKVQKSNSFSTLNYAYALQNIFAIAGGISYDLKGSLAKKSGLSVLFNKFFLNDIDATLTYKVGFLYHDMIRIGGYLGVEQTFYTTKVGNVRPKLQLSMGTTTFNNLLSEIAVTYTARNYNYPTNGFLASSFLPRTFKTSTTVQTKVDTFFLGVAYDYAYVEPLQGSILASYKNGLTVFAEAPLENKTTIYFSLGFEAYLQEGMLDQTIHASVGLFTTIKQKKLRKRSF